ncbi:MAG: hypothetical protein H7831_16050 [Magnetococcus sp. WYHC-3]
MKLLASFKPEWYERPHHSYGVIARIDWPSRQVEAVLRLPSASYRHRDAFMAPLTGGICRLGERLFAAMWNHLVEIDLRTLTVTNAVSHPWMADLHGMTTDGKHLWVVASASECLLCLDPDTLDVMWRWGPDDAILESHPPAGFPPLQLWQRWRRQRAAAVFPAEWRHVHKSRSPLYRHHLNDVSWHRGALYLTTLSWFQQPGGAVLRLDPRDRRASFLATPGSLAGPHDGEDDGGRLLVTQSRARAVAWVDHDGTVTSRTVTPDPCFVRGLCPTPTGWLVGFTRLRRSADPSWIVEYDREFLHERGRMDVSGFYPPEQGCAVHALLALDEG